MSRRIVGPFNRVEGDLEVHLDIEDNAVQNAWVVSPLYRGFEQMLHGKDPRDAMVYTPRICGICSVSQSSAAAAALASLQNLETPPNGEYARNIVVGAENIADHLTHFYLFFMPDFCRDVYAEEPWFAAAQARFKAVEGAAVRDVLPARAAFMHVMGTMAGKWPHTLAVQPGGSSRPIEVQEQMRLIAIFSEFRKFLETTLFGDTLEAVLAIETPDALQAWTNRGDRTKGDFRHFLAIAEALNLAQAGRATDRFLSYGAYAFKRKPLFRGGVFENGTRVQFDPALIVEDLSHAWLANRNEAQHPYQGITIPDADAEGGYTWCKAPRLDGRVVEVGALARQVVDGHPLIRVLVAESGGNVRNRVIARLLEIARTLVAMEEWLRALKPREPFCIDAPLPDEGEGCGLIEAARGSLGHWVRIKNGHIINYQIVSPTTWNFSPRDGSGTPGALEAALIGAGVRNGESDPVMVQHIVRSFDPCMVCTVH